MEDGEMLKTPEITEGDLSAADDGLIDLVDLHEENPKRYYAEEWHAIESWEDNNDIH
jgi:hypothetical protein